MYCSIQSHKVAGAMDEQVSALCQRVGHGMKDGSVSTKQANKWIVDQGNVSFKLPSHHWCHFTCNSLTVIVVTMNEKYCIVL